MTIRTSDVNSDIFWKLRYSPSTRVIQTWVRFFHITNQIPHFKRLFYWTQISGQLLYRGESSKGVFTVHRPRAFHAREGWLEKGGIVLLFGFVYLQIFVCTFSHLPFCCHCCFLHRFFVVGVWSYLSVLVELGYILVFCLICFVLFCCVLFSRANIGGAWVGLTHLMHLDVWGGNPLVATSCCCTCTCACACACTCALNLNWEEVLMQHHGQG